MHSHVVFNYNAKRTLQTHRYEVIIRLVCHHHSSTHRIKVNDMDLNREYE